MPEILEVVFERETAERKLGGEVKEGDIVVFQNHVSVMVGFALNRHTQRATIQCSPFCEPTYRQLLNHNN